MSSGKHDGSHLPSEQRHQRGLKRDRFGDSHQEQSSLISSSSAKSGGSHEPEAGEAPRLKNDSSDYWKKASGWTVPQSKSRENSGTKVDDLLQIEDSDYQRIQSGAPKSAPTNIVKSGANYERASTSTIYSYDQDDDVPTSILMHYAQDSSEDER